MEEKHNFELVFRQKMIIKIRYKDLEYIREEHLEPIEQE